LRKALGRDANSVTGHPWSVQSASRKVCVARYCFLTPPGAGDRLRGGGLGEPRTVADTPIQVGGTPSKATAPPSVLSVLSDAVKGSIAGVQDYSRLSFRALTNLVSGRSYPQDMVEQMDLIGVGSLPIVLLSGLFIGAVMVLQTGSQFTRFGQTALTGDIVAIALVRELGPTLSGLLVAGRCSSGIASELGSMLVTEQVDAMRAMGTDPSRKLVTPRVVATMLMLPLLTALMDFLGLIGGCIASVFTLRLDAVQFWTRAIDALEFGDLMQGISKPVVFGLIVATVGCYKGLSVRGGTQGVGRATTEAVVVSSVLILVSNLFLTKLALYLSDKVF
jgi:phospholipid/cholesterol/gamma-HCH transport system permease protein